MTDPDVSADALARIGTNNCYKYIIRILVFIIKSSSNNFHLSHPSGKNIPGDASLWSDQGSSLIHRHLVQSD